jgi:hypothetical protein
MIFDAKVHDQVPASNGRLYLRKIQEKPTVFANTPLADERSPPVLSSTFPRSYHMGSVLIPLERLPKNGLPLRSIYQFIAYCARMFSILFV